MDILKASKKLSDLDLKFIADNLEIDVTWFRVMTQDGEWCINRHTHSTYEFHFIRKGCCTVALDEGKFHAAEGEFYLTTPGIFHEQSASGELVEYCINCDLRLLEDRPSEAQYILRILSQAACKSCSDSCGIMGFFEQALKEANDQKIGYVSNIQSLAALIIFSAARIIAADIPVPYEIPVKVKQDDNRFKQIEKFIEDNINNRLSTRDIAGFMFLSEKQVCRIIANKKGVTTKELIISMKLKKAKELLKQTELPLKKISDLLGYSSEYYFSQFFKREEGYPPGIYRINIRNV
jgi:AraC-like DNA-binding protein